MSEIKTKPQTREFDEGYERTFGDRKPQRGRWVYDERQGKLVPADEYVRPAEALNAPIIADRIHEGTISPVDGSDIGSRRKRREHMAQYGIADRSDYSPEYLSNVKKQEERTQDRSRREALSRAFYDVMEKRRH